MGLWTSIKKGFSKIKNFAKSLWQSFYSVLSFGVSLVLGTIVGWIYYGYLLLVNIGKKRTKLSKCLREVLENYFPRIKLGDVRIIENANGVPHGKRAVTEGYNIFFKGHFSEDNSDDLRLLFHELVHVNQYEVYGYEAFYVLYGYGWMSNYFSYENIPLEKEAVDYVNQKFSNFEENYKKQCNPSYTSSSEIALSDWVWTYY